MTVFDLLERWKDVQRGIYRSNRFGVTDQAHMELRNSFNQMAQIQGQGTDVRLWTNVPKIWILENSRRLFILENT